VFLRVLNRYFDLYLEKLNIENINLKKTIDFVINVMGDIPAGKLSTWSHKEGRP
jgi:hypothetical protein